MLGRRELLGALGGAAASFPFVPRLLQSQAGAPKPKALFFWTPNDAIERGYWVPEGGSKAEGSQYAMTALHPMMHELEPFRSDMVLVGDTTNGCKRSDPHSGSHFTGCHMLVNRHVHQTNPDREGGCLGGGISLDHYLTQQLGGRTIVLGAPNRGESQGFRYCSFTDRAAPAVPIVEPRTAFERLFGSGDSMAEDPTRPQRQRMLQVVGRQLDRLRPQLPSEHHRMLDGHIHGLAELQDRLANRTVIQCDATGSPTRSRDSYGRDHAAILLDHIDVAVKALACDAAQVATLQFGTAQGDEYDSIEWPSIGLRLPEGQHATSHHFYENNYGRPEDIRNREELERGYHHLAAQLLQRLRDTPDVDGSPMLDHTLVVVFKHLGRHHGQNEQLWMLAGGKALGLTGGRFYSFPDEPHNKLLVNILNLFGIEADHFGDPDLSTGSFPLL
ncbi:MAG: DUF1552 domain-containing protein [Myxococcota bacterium]